MTFEKCGTSDPEHTVGLIVDPMNEVDAISTVASERSCLPALFARHDRLFADHG